jgi:hypothetical protein
VTDDELQQMKVTLIDLSKQMPLGSNDSETALHIAGTLVYEVERLTAELETERMRLVACSTASIQNTETSRAARIEQENPYWSVPYGDVCRAIDREMEHRAEAKRLRVEVELLGQEVVRLRDSRPPS